MKAYTGIDKEYWHVTYKQDKNSKHYGEGPEIGLVQEYLKKSHSPLLHAFLQLPIFYPKVREVANSFGLGKQGNYYHEQYDNDQAKIIFSGFGYLDSDDFFVYAKILQLLDRNNAHTLEIHENDLMKECGYKSRDLYRDRKSRLRTTIQRLSCIGGLTLRKGVEPIPEMDNYDCMSFKLLPQHSFCVKTKTYHFEIDQGLFFAYAFLQSWQTIDLDLYAQIRGSAAKILYLFIESKFNRNNIHQTKVNFRRDTLAHRLGYVSRNMATKDMTKGVKVALDSLVRTGYLSNYEKVMTDRNNPTYHIYPASINLKGTS